MMLQKKKSYIIDANEGKISMNVHRGDTWEVVSDNSLHLGCGTENPTKS